MEDTPRTLQKRIFIFFRENLLVSALLLVGLIFLGAGLISFISRPDINKIEFQKGTAIESASTSAEPAKVVVDVSGEVIKPGVYSLDPSARVEDALSAAGGLSSSADKEFVAKSINLAMKLSDGMKIYVPKVGEAAQATVSSSSGPVSSGYTSSTISINSATESELDSLPGVGPVTAQKIIAGRPYSSVDELLSRKIVGQSIYSKIKDQIGL